MMRRSDVALGNLPSVVSATVWCAVASCGLACAPAIPQNSPVDKVRWLQQNWSAAERHWAHHASQGTATLPLPYKWFVALEQPSLTLGDAGSFTDPSYLSRFGFIPSPVSVKDAATEVFGYAQKDRAPYIPKIGRYAAKYGENPDRLPVGFARLEGTDPTTGAPVDAVGFTCAACHTGQLEYNRVSVRIDGAPAMTDVGKFRESLGVALAYTKYLPGRFSRFTDRVLGDDSSKSERDALKKALGELLERGQALKKITAPKEKKDVTEGFARLDALTRIGNRVFFNDLMRPGGDNADAVSNNRSIVAPVNFPHIWDTSWFDWVQYDASIMQPMVRNAGEALGVSALVNLTDPEKNLYQSTVAVSEIFELEQLLAGENPMKGHKGFKGLRAPEWPEEILGKIDDGPKSKASRGKKLYMELCAHCHMAPVDSAEFWSGDYWSEPNDAGERYLRVRNIPLTVVGTDPAQAKILTERMVKIPAHLKIPPPPKGKLCYAPESMTGAANEVPFAWALGVVVEKIVTKWYDDSNVDPATRRRMNGYRPNCLQAELAYKARPLDGIWATAPFLHNGAVPNLYELLSPADERSSKFYLGSRLFDPGKVGYDTAKLKGGFELDTSLPGNSNKGHEFADENKDSSERRKGRIGRRLEEREKWELLEFLKTL